MYKPGLFFAVSVFLLFSGSVFGQTIVTNEDSLFGEEPEAVVSDDTSLFGSEDSDESSEDDMFSNTSPLVEDVGTEKMDDLSSILLTSDSGFEIGGDFFFDLSADWNGIDTDNISGSNVSDSFSFDLGTYVYLDARPDEDTRIFLKAEITAPFYTVSDEDSIFAGREFEDIVSIKELFSDFNWNNDVFFRAGKQTVNWGVGRFFSPADLLSLSRIDPEDPDADLDGPVAVKVNYPLIINNYYLYTVIPMEADSYSDIALAPMAEFVIGNSEISVGAYYQYDHAPVAMTTVTSSKGDLSFYSEGVISYGSDKVFVESGGTSVTTYDSTIFFKGTIGAGYSWVDDLSNFDLNFSAQYYYNGEGYDDPSLVNIYDTPQLVSLGLVSMSDPSSITSLLADSGQHYGAGSVIWRDLLGSDLTFSVLYIENFSSLSGMVKPEINWDINDGLSVSLSVVNMFGDPGEEYAMSGNSASVSIGVSIGDTSF